MDIKSALLEEHSKAQALHIASYVMENPGQLEILMQLFFYSEYRIAQRAGMVISKLDDLDAAILLPYQLSMIELLKSDCKPAIARNVFRYLQGKTIPESHQAIVYDLGLSYLSSTQSPIAVKAFAMTTAAGIATLYPELSTELKEEIERQYPYGSAGFKSRAKIVLKKMAHKCRKSPRMFL
jgi:hypothetical protein